MADFWSVLPDYTTAGGTLLLAGVTVWIAMTDRRRDDERRKQDRAATAENARSEWAHQRAEREAEWRQRLDEIAREHAPTMLAAVRAVADASDGFLNLAQQWALGAGAKQPVGQAAEALVRLRHAVVLSQLCHRPELARRFQVLLDVCNRATELSEADRKRVAADILGYCVYVMQGIDEWVDDRPFTGARAFGPVLDRVDGAFWAPMPESAGWIEAVQSEPKHPQWDGRPRI